MVEKAKLTASEVLARAERRLNPQPAASDSSRWPTDHSDTVAVLAERHFAERCSRCNDTRILRYPTFAHGQWYAVAAWCSCKARWHAPENAAPLYDSLKCSEWWHTQDWLDVELRRLRAELSEKDLQRHLAHGKRLRDLRGGAR